MAKIIEIITSLVNGHFYGELVVKFQDGKITVCRKIESIKIEDN